MHKRERTEIRSNWRDPNNNCGLPENAMRTVRATIPDRKPRASAVRTTQVPPTRRSSRYRALFPEPTLQQVRLLQLNRTYCR